MGGGDDAEASLERQRVISDVCGCVCVCVCVCLRVRVRERERERKVHTDWLSSRGLRVST